MMKCCRCYCVGYFEYRNGSCECTRFGGRIGGRYWGRELGFENIATVDIVGWRNVFIGDFIILVMVMLFKDKRVLCLYLFYY